MHSKLVTFFFNLIFFVYTPITVLVSMEVIGELPFGWIFLSCSLSLPFLIFINNDVKGIALGKPILFFYLFLFLFSVTLVNNYTSSNSELVKGHVSNIIVLLTLYILALKIDFSNTLFKKVGVAAFLVSTLFILYNRNFIMNFWDFLLVSLNYQGIGMCYFILSLPIFMLENRILKNICFVLSMVCLNIIGARTEMISLLFIIVIFEIFSRPRQIRVILLIVLTLLFLIFLLIGKDILNFIGLEKVTVLFNLEKDESWIERKEFLNEGLNTIKNNIIFGKYGNYEEGKYIHNILSAWVDLGLFGFLVLFLSLTFILFEALKIIYVEHAQKKDVLFLGFALTIFIVAVFSKQYTYPLIGFCVGMYNHFSNKRYNILLNKN
ncbi:O-antigen ligase family protein [Chryseobacterium sp. IHB B 17019]|jgi:hypothetical protein|uniref:O-antigen ligase family protein n=1 Tax=Chryseobacterium sp. IHB B 17019 TaxID=1721091 RepID=UPI0009E7EBF6|nr:O-antigen ligase family protein [Chryseobacterium sp. IHB B 17019]